MTNPIDFDDFTKNYNELLRESTGFFSANEAYFAKYKIDITRRQITHPISRVLEYGCGIGRNIPFLKAAFPDASILGSDVSHESLKLAIQQNPNVDFFHELELGSIEPFDLIFVASVFHHISPNERAAVIKILFKRLRAGGQIIIFEHNPYNPVTRKIVKDCPYDKDAILLAPLELKTYLKQAEFLNIQSSFCLFFPPRFSNLISLESYLGWLPLGGQYWVKAKKKDALN